MPIDATFTTFQMHVQHSYLAHLTALCLYDFINHISSIYLDVRFYWC